VSTLRRRVLPAPLPFAGLAILLSGILYLFWDSAAPAGTWNIFIPIHFEAAAPPDQLDPALSPPRLLAEYRAALVVAVTNPTDQAAPPWTISQAPGPRPGILLNLTTPCTSGVAEIARSMPARAANEIDRKRGDLFRRLGLQLASEAERMEERLASPPGEPGDVHDGQHLRAIDLRAGALEQERQELLSQILRIEKRLSPGKRPAVSRPRKRAKGVRTATRPRLRKAPIPRKLPAAQAKSTRQSLQQDLARLRHALETVDRALLELSQKRQELELRHERTAGANAELVRINERNRRLAALFESGYGRPVLSAIEATVPPLHLRAWSTVRPLGLLLGFPLAWLLLAGRRGSRPRTTFANTDVPLLGTLPSLSRETLEEMLHPSSFATSAPREALAIRNICIDIKHRTEVEGWKTIAIVGARAGCGTSAAAALVTAALTNELHHILLLDIHWARPSQHRLWWVPWATGATNGLASTGVPAAIRAGNQGEAPRAVVVPAGPRPPDPEAALEAVSWTKWLSGFPGRPTELLIADAGNLEDTPETLPQRLQAFDATILVARPGSDEAVSRALHLLAPGQKPVLGILFNEGGEPVA